MGLIELILVIALVGLFVWVVTTIIPMPPKFQQIIYVVSVVFMVLYVLNGLGLLHGFHDIRLGK